MEKLYKKIGWKNKPNLATPLGATNLKKIDEAIDELDNRTIELDNKDAEQGRHIEGLYAETRKNTQAIEEGFDALKIVPTASGSPVYIFDASNMGLEDIDFFGESKQLQTTGAQLFDINDKYDFSTSFVVDSDGWITFNYDNSAGTSTVYLNASTNKSNLLAISTNYLSVVEVESISNATIYPTSNNEGVLKGQFETAYTSMTLPTSKGVFVNIVKTRASFDDAFTMARTIVSVPAGKIGTAKFRMSIIKDITVTANTFVYEKYSGGKASPNPDCPQPIESKIVNRVDVMGGQLLDLKANTSSTLNGFSVSVESGYILKVSGTPTAVWANLTDFDTKKLPKGKYTFSVDKTPTELGVNLIGIKFRKSLADSTNVTHLITGSNKSITLERTEDYELVQIYVEGCDTSKSYNFTFKVMLNAGETAFPFEQFKGIQTVNLSAPIELNGIGGVRDTDKLKKFGVVVFDGSDDEHWATYDTRAGNRRWYSNSISTKAKANTSTATVPNILCTHYKPVSPSDTYNDIQGITISTASATDGMPVLYLYDESFNVDDRPAWRAHLQANPMTVVYELEEPIETELPQADIDAIKNLHSYKPNTVVMNDADAEMDVHYVADVKIYIDKKFEALANAIVNQ